MRRDATTAKYQRGVTLVGVVFLIAVLGAVSAYLVAASSRGQLVPVASLSSAQAYQAARAGLEWGTYRAIRDGASDPLACDGASFSPGGVLSNFTVTVNCSSSTHRDGTPPTEVQIFLVKAVATRGNPGDLDFAQREIRAVVSPSAPQ